MDHSDNDWVDSWKKDENSEPETKEDDPIKSKEEVSRRVPLFLGEYGPRRPCTRPKNKLRLKYKLMENPWLKDLVINVDDSSPEKDRKRRIKLIKNQRSQRKR